VQKVVDRGFLKGLAISVGVPAIVIIFLGLLFRPPTVIYVHAVPVWATPVVQKNITIAIDEDHASWAMLYCNVSSNTPISVWLARASDYYTIPLITRLDASTPNYTVTTGWGVLIDNSSVAYIEQAILHVYGNNVSFAVNLTKGKYVLFIGASQPNAVIEVRSCFITYNIYTTGPSPLEQFFNRVFG
jgi:hypothetical protein